MKHKPNLKIHRKSTSFLILFLFIFISVAGLFAEDIQCVWTNVEKIVAVGDLHGDYDNFVRILRINKIIDGQNHWIAGKTHLVQIGDVLDRGNHAKKIFDLIKKLEKEAKKAGGKVHMLLGNHEEMNITGLAFDRERYVSAEQLRSFLPDKYRERRERSIRRRLNINPPNETDTNSSLDPNIEAFWEKQSIDAMNKPNHPVRKEYMKTFSSIYAKWILQHNAVIKINNTVFVHGGISKKYSTLPLKDINARLRDELEAYRIANLRGKDPLGEPDIVFDQNGPLWYRDLAIADEEYFEETVDEILNNLDAEHIISAHTPTRIRSNAYRGRFHEKVWIIDTSISRAYPRGSLSALKIKNFGKKNSDFELWIVPREENNTSIGNICRAPWRIWSGYITNIHTFFFDGTAFTVKNNDCSFWG
jgi:hypothetical protein